MTKRMVFIGFLLASAAAGSVWWLLLPRPPTPRLTFESNLYVAGVTADGKKAILQSAYNRPQRRALKDLATGNEEVLPVPKPEAEHFFCATTPTFYWSRIGPKSGTKQDERGPFIAYDRKTLQRLATIDPPGVTRQLVEVHFGEKLMAAYRENWIWPCLRFQVYDPRTGKKEVDRLLPMDADFFRPQGLYPSPDGQFVATRFWYKSAGPPAAFRWATGILSVGDGKLHSLWHSCWIDDRAWSRDGSELMVTAQRLPEKQNWIERWDWKNRRKLGEYCEGAPAPVGLRPVLRWGVGWLPATQEWLMMEHLVPWSERHRDLSQFLYNRLGISFWASSQDSLFAVNAQTGEERPLAQEVHPSPRLFALPNDELLVELKRVESAPDRARYAVIPLTGPLPLPFYLRLAASLLAGTLVIVLCLRLSRRQAAVGNAIAAVV